MNENTLFQGTVVFIIGSVDTKARKSNLFTCIISYRNMGLKIIDVQPIQLRRI